MKETFNLILFYVCLIALVVICIAIPLQMYAAASKKKKKKINPPRKRGKFTVIDGGKK